MPKSSKTKTSTVYQCNVCGKVYDTKKEANACAKPINKDFKPGDIIRFNYKVWRIVGIDEPYNFTLERVPEYLEAFGYEKKHQLKEGCFLKTHYCGNSIELLQKKEVEDIIKHRRKELIAAEKLLEQVRG